MALPETCTLIAPGALSEPEVRFELARVEQSPLFANSPRLCRLLRYLVECSLAGSSRDLREYSVGVEVFDRGASFDPHEDTIVRVTARRLRQRLAVYYAGAGRGDRIQFRVPKGHYLVEFCTLPRIAPDSAPTASWLLRRRVPLAAFAGVLLILGLSVTGLRQVLQPLYEDKQQQLRARAAQGHLLTGQHLFNRRGAGDLPNALDEFERALAIDPTLVSAWVGVAGSLKILGEYGEIDERQSIEEQRRALSAALALDPGSAEANARMGYVYHRLGDRGRGDLYIERALQNGNQSALVLSIAAGQARVRGDMEETLSLQRQAVALDPLGVVNRGNLGHWLYQAGDFPGALEQLRRAGKLSPAGGLEFGPDIVKVLVLLARYVEAEETLATLPASAEREQAAALLYHAQGRAQESGQALQALARREPTEAASLLAEVYAFRGETEQALDQVEMAHRLSLERWGDTYLAVWMTVGKFQDSPFLASLRDQPRWHAFINEVARLWQLDGTVPGHLPQSWNEVARQLP